MIKTGMLNLMRASGLFHLMRLIHGRRALILTYHRFSADGETESDEKTPARVFAEQLDYLMAHYRVISLTRLAETIAGGRALPPRLAAITIDDGYSDAYSIAYPLLRRRGLPASVFVVTEFADRRSWLWTDKARFLTSRAEARQLTTTTGGDELRLELHDAASRLAASERINAVLKRLPDEAKEEAIERLQRALGVEAPPAPPAEFASITWDQAREMEAGGIEIGSHTRTHPILTNIGDERLRRELVESKLRLEEVLRRKVEQFCYPNGDNDQRVQREVARAGYLVAVTTVSGLNKRGDDPLTLRRVHTERDLAHFAQSVSGFEQLKNNLRTFAQFPGHATRMAKG